VDTQPASAKEAPKARGRRPVFRSHCPRCGTRFPLEGRGEWFETSARCAECGVAVIEDTTPLAPGGAELAYTLDGLALVERTAVTADLIELRVPFRWEDDLVLVVPTIAEDLMDRLVDDVSATGDDDAPPEASS